MYNEANSIFYVHSKKGGSTMARYSKQFPPKTVTLSNYQCNINKNLPSKYTDAKCQNDDKNNFFSPDDNSIHTDKTFKGTSIQTKKPSTTFVKKKEDPHIKEIQERYSILNRKLDDLLTELEETIIGQHESVKKLLFLVYHNQFLNMLEDLDGEELLHLTGLAIGPSGSGKTTTISKIASLFNVPFIKINATSLTSAGYSGTDVDSILLNLLKSAGGDIDLAERGIVFIDEIDKKMSSEPNNTAGRDINGTAVQEELLKIFEPSIVYIGKDNKPFDTHRLTVIGGGYFNGLNEIREKRLHGPKTLGFSSNDKSSFEDKNAENVKTFNYLSAYSPEDLIEYGFISELVGRILVIAEFKRLSVEDALDIIYSKNSLLQQYLKIFNARSVDLVIDPILLTEIAEDVAHSSTCVRDLNRRIFELLYPALYATEQTYTDGICELDSNGNFVCAFKNNDDEPDDYKNNASLNN